MKYLCSLALVLWICISGSIEENDVTYPKYTLKANSTEDNNKFNFVFSWNPVKNWDEKNPIIGYSVVIWEMKTNNITSNEYYNWVNRQRVQICVDVDKVSTSAYPPKPIMITVPAAERQAVFENAKRGVWYFHAAFAFTKNGQGPFSPVSCCKMNGTF